MNNKRKTYVKINRVARIDEIFTLLDEVIRDLEEDIDDSMNDSDTESVLEESLENELDSDDEPLNLLVSEAHYHLGEYPTIKKTLEKGSSKAEKEIKGKYKEKRQRQEKGTGKRKNKRNKRKSKRKAKKMRSEKANPMKLDLIGEKYTPYAKEQCSLRVNIIHQFPEHHISFDVFSVVTNLDGLVRHLVSKGNLHAQQNRREFHTNEQETRSLLGINSIMSINKLPTIKSIWNVYSSLVRMALEMLLLDQDLKQS